MRTGDRPVVKTLRSGIVVSAASSGSQSPLSRASPGPAARRNGKENSRSNGLDRSVSEKPPQGNGAPRPRLNRRHSADCPPGFRNAAQKVHADSSSEGDTINGLTTRLQAATRDGTALKDECEAIKKLEEMKLEKERADEQNRQMQLQTQALIDDRARIKAEKEALERDHKEMLAKLELLEVMYQSSGQDYHASDENDSGQEEGLSPQKWADVEA